VRIALVHNPASGDAQHSHEEIHRQLQDAGHTVTLARLPEVPLDPSIDVVVVAGGDGSVRRTALAMLGSSVPIAVVPRGTANNIARSLGMMIDPEHWIGRLESMSTRSFDLGVVSGPWGHDLFLEGTGFGPFSRSALLLSHPAQSEEMRGHDDELTRDRQVVEEMVWNYAAQTCRIELDDQILSGEFIAVQIMNLPFVGPNLEFAPAANPADGLLDVVAIREADRAEFAAFVGARHQSPMLPSCFHASRTARALVRWDGAEVHVDDEIRTIGFAGVFLTKVLPGRLTFLGM
jgi:diacylglycerol kinase family enzyme